MREKLKASIKGQLIIIVLACWLLPVLLTVGIMSYLLSKNIDNQVMQTITATATTAVDACIQNINSSVSVSRSATYNTAIKRAWDKYKREEDRTTLYSSVTNYLNQEYKYNDNFLTTILYFSEEPGELYFCQNDRLSTGVESKKRYLEKANSRVESISSGLGTATTFLNVDGSCYMIRNLVDSAFERYAVLVMEINTDRMFGELSNVTWGTGAYIWLGGQGLLLKGSPIDKAVYMDIGPERKFIQTDASTTILGREHTLAGDFSYYVQADKSALLNQFTGFKNVIVWTLILVVPLLVLVVMFFYKNISAPINRLIAAARRIKQGELGTVVGAALPNREFVYLGDAFDSMSLKLKEQFQQTFGQEIAIRDAKIMALQCQINPHFLNNTLEIINWEARISDNAKISKMIEALSTMLDAAMDRRGKPLVRLSEEMMYVDSYLYIISERLGKRLVINKEIDPAVLEYHIPLLILQPIIENAVEHGIQPQQRGRIVIRAYAEDNYLILEIENDGAMTGDDLKKIKKLIGDDADVVRAEVGSLGIRNVNQRLKMIYGDNCGLSIKMNEERHTIAKIIVNIS